MQKKQFEFTVEKRAINDMVHGSIKIFKPISDIIDTPEFQRLRHIKQLSVADLVYPSANHNRFSHSLGVYHLAFEVAKQLLHKTPDKLDSRDVLCVSIAGLIHDLGHGPFSHTFDGPFIKNANPNCHWTHEQGSKLMFRHLLENNPNVRDSLEEYLDKDDFDFIEELLTPPKSFLDAQKNWVPKGRPMSKSFLYDIISNPHDGLDVDKMDYFLRDSKCAGVDIVFSVERFKRLLTHMDIAFSTRYGFQRLAYSDKSRIHLHSNLYKHKTVLAMEEQLVEILLLADPYLKFAGANGKLYTMSESIEDMSAYIKVTDSVLEMIGASSDENLKPAQKLLSDLEHRRIYRFLGKFQFNNHEEADGATGLIGKFLTENGLTEKDYKIKKAEIDQGFGTSINPMNRIVFFSSDGSTDSPSFSAISSMQCPGFIVVCVYLTAYESRRDLRKNLGIFIAKNCFNNEQKENDVESTVDIVKKRRTDDEIITL